MFVSLSAEERSANMTASGCSDVTTGQGRKRKSLSPLAINEIQVKILVRYYYKWSKMGEIQIINTTRS